MSLSRIGASGSQPPAQCPCKSPIQESKSQLTRRRVSRPGSPLAAKSRRRPRPLAVALQYQQEESRIWRAQAEEARLLVVLRALPLTRGVTVHWQAPGVSESTAAGMVSPWDQLSRKAPTCHLVRLSEPGCPRRHHRDRHHDSDPAPGRRSLPLSEWPAAARPGPFHKGSSLSDSEFKFTASGLVTVHKF